MSTHTAFLSKLIGLFLIFGALAMLLHEQSGIATVTSLIHDRPSVLIIGMLGLVTGFAMVLTHNVWSGGVLPVLVTLVGWTILFRGALVLFLSPDRLLNLVELVHLGSLFPLYMAVALVLGVYLTYAGFRASR
jgi:hypothetical protein